jgi:hypothetical protein
METSVDSVSLLMRERTADRSWALTLTAGNDLRFDVSGDGAAVTNVSSTAALADGTWYFGVGRHDPDADQLYLTVFSTGALWGETSAAHSTGIQSTTGDFNMGVRHDGGYFDGEIDEAFIFDDLLSTGEIDWLWNSGSGRAYSDTNTGVSFTGRMILIA